MMYYKYHSGIWKKWNRQLAFVGILLVMPIMLNAQPELKIMDGIDGYEVVITDDHLHQIRSPDEGLWSVATGWKDSWPDSWFHGSPGKMEISGDWTILTGYIEMPGGRWLLQDAYRPENGMIKCIRRFEWDGTDTLKEVTLSVKWKVNGNQLKPFLPGILYYGNPSGKKNRPDCVPFFNGKPGELALFEEHRFPMPFVCLESGKELFGAAMHSVPSPVKNRNLTDHWWSMGILAREGYTEMNLLSGPVAYNHQKGVAKALQCSPLKYGPTYMTVQPGTVIEKTCYLDVYAIQEEGTAFQRPVHQSMDIFRPFYTEDLPSFVEIIRSKYLFAKKRWMEKADYAGFNMYPDIHIPEIVMGWAGQAASCGYALQVLQKYFDDPEIHDMVQQSLDFLSGSPVTRDGFPVRFNVTTGEWYDPDHVSMGQSMYNFALAIRAAGRNELWDAVKWEFFLEDACDYATNRILSSDWKPVSTAEAFYIAPLALASGLFGEVKYKEAAIRAAEYYAERHLDMKEPYWGGTLDARCEDKEGAWAAFQGFLAVYELTANQVYLKWAKHACDVVLSYTVIWDIPLPAGRMSDHFFKTRGWTVVSPQNQHIDVFGVFYAPDIYRMGEITGNERLKKLARVMYRSCGQLIDPFGSQGEQLQQTNFAQRGDMSDIYTLRGGYSEDWTVFWITAHFLNAAARFEEMGVVF